MQALYDGPNGTEWKDSKVQIYGWINPGFNFSTSKHSNLPEDTTSFPIAWTSTRQSSISSAYPTLFRPIISTGVFVRENPILEHLLMAAGKTF
jgi:hypothetical protein